MRLFVERVRADQVGQLNPAPADAGRLPNGSVLVKQGESLVFRLRLDRQRYSALNAPIPAHRERSLRYLVPLASLLDPTHGFRVTRVSGRGVPRTRRVSLSEATRTSDGAFIRLDLPPVTFGEPGPLVLRFTARFPGLSPSELRRAQNARGLRNARHTDHTPLVPSAPPIWIDLTERYEVADADSWARRRGTIVQQRTRRYDQTNDPLRGFRSPPRTSNRVTIERLAERGRRLLGAGPDVAETTAALEPYRSYDRLHQSLTALDEIRRSVRLARGRASLGLRMAEGMAFGASGVASLSEPGIASREEEAEAARGPIELAAGLVPVLGDVIGIIEAVMGRSFLTETELSTAERALGGTLSVFGLLSVVGGVVSRVAGALARTAAFERLVAQVGRTAARAFRNAARALGDPEQLAHIQRLLRRVDGGTALGERDKRIVLGFLRRLEEYLIASRMGRARSATDRIGQAAYDEASEHLPVRGLRGAERAAARQGPIRLPGLDVEFRLVRRNGHEHLAVCS